MYDWDGWKSLAETVIKYDLRHPETIFTMQMQRETLWVRRYRRPGRRDLLRRIPYRVRLIAKNDSDLLRKWDCLVLETLDNDIKPNPSSATTAQVAIEESLVRRGCPVVFPFVLTLTIFSSQPHVPSEKSVILDQTPIHLHSTTNQIATQSVI
jgi:hypothetical protein